MVKNVVFLIIGELYESWSGYCSSCILRTISRRTFLFFTSSIAFEYLCLGFLDGFSHTFWYIRTLVRWFRGDVFQSCVPETQIYNKNLALSRCNLLIFDCKSREFRTAPHYQPSLHAFWKTDNYDTWNFSTLNWRIYWKSSELES